MKKRVSKLEVKLALTKKIFALYSVVVLSFTLYFCALRFKFCTSSPVSAQTVDPVKSQVLDELNRATTDDFVPNEILVKFRSYILETQYYDDTDDVLTTTGIHYKEKEKLFAKSFDEAPELFNIYKVQVLAGTAIKTAVTKLNNHPDVAYAEPNYQAYAFFTPNDPYFNQQWNMNTIQAPQAWDLSTGSANVTVAIVDTGVQLDHKDFKSKVTSNGYDFINDDNNPTDDHGHGTHCAGIAAAATNNATSVAGVGFDIMIMPVKVLDSSGNGPYSVITQGIRHAVNNGAKVVSLSFGGPYYSSTLESAVNYAWNQGVVVVAAAGNCGEGCPDEKCQSVNEVGYPGFFTNVIAVASTTNLDNRSCFSTRGTYVDIAAPGSNIFSTVLDPGNQYPCGCTIMSGTSMATPHVTGLAGLIFSANSSLTNSQVRQIIETTAVDLGFSGKDSSFGHGRINAFAAVQAAIGGTPSPTSTPTPLFTPTPTPTSVPTTTPTPTPVPTATPTLVPPTSTPTPTPPAHCQPLGDIDCSRKVNALDLSALLSVFGTADPKADLDDSGKVNALDLSILLSNFGKGS